MGVLGVARDVFAVIAASRTTFPKRLCTARPTPETSYLYSISPSELVLREQLSIRLVVEQRIKSLVQVTHHVRDSIRDPVRMTAIRTDHRSFLNMNLCPYDLRWPPTRP